MGEKDDITKYQHSQIQGNSFRSEVFGKVVEHYKKIAL